MYLFSELNLMASTYVVRSHMSDKALKNETEMLIKQTKYIQNPKNAREEGAAVTFTTLWFGVSTIIIDTLLM